MFRRYEDLCDVVSLMIYCPSEKSFLLSKENSGEYWLPSSKCEKCWKFTANKLNFELFGVDSGPLRVCIPIRVNKFWLPDHVLKAVYHVVYKVIVKTELKKRTKLKGAKTRYQWLTNAELDRNRIHMSLRSPEIVMLASMTSGIGVKDSETLDMEPGNLVEFCEEDAVVGPEAAGGAVVTANPHFQLLKAASYSREDQLRFYREFVTNVFPAMYMSQHIFTVFMMDIGWQRSQCSSLFRAADVCGRGGLTMHEVVHCGLEIGFHRHRAHSVVWWSAALEPNTDYTGAAADTRALYVFRYFDSNRDLKLEYSEFKELIAATRRVRQLPIDTLSVAKDADMCLRQLSLAPSSPLPQSEFLRAVSEARLLGTSELLRAGKSIIGYLYDLQDRPREETDASKVPTPPATTTLLYTALNPPRQPVKLSTADWSVAMYTVRLHRSAPDEMLELANFDEDTVSSSTTHLLRSSNSEHRLGPTSLPTETVNSIHYFATAIEKASARNRASVASMSANAPAKQSFSWYCPTEEISFGSTLMKLVETARPIFEREPRLLRISSPVYAIGDLHGNLSAMMSIEAALWPSGPALTPAKLLFLGDFVDRGPHGTELMAYLLAIKLQRPRGVFLLRGNHETRDIQKMFTFYTECLTKYGEAEGNKIWSALNTVFDVLPLAAVVDDKIFCCHGGIPPPWVCPLISGINKIPVPLPKPAEQSSIAWELLWNDPIKQNKVTSTVAMELTANEGFAINSRRGTGHVFDQNALDRFLLANQLSHVVRAHELHHAGFMCELRGRLVSVFSSARYCGGNNDTGLVLLDNGKLRLMRITHNI